MREREKKEDIKITMNIEKKKKIHYKYKKIMET